MPNFNIMSRHHMNRHHAFSRLQGQRTNNQQIREQKGGKHFPLKSVNANANFYFFEGVWRFQEDYMRARKTAETRKRRDQTVGDRCFLGRNYYVCFNRILFVLICRLVVCFIRFLFVLICLLVVYLIFDSVDLLVYCVF